MTNPESRAFDFEDWGLIEYREAWSRQEQYVAQILAGQRRSTLVFCEHPPVITMGRNGSPSSMIATIDQLAVQGIDYVENNRGGDATAHNPGQLVGYPIFDLRVMRQDLHWFLRAIEDCIIGTLGAYSVPAGRFSPHTGVWIEEQRKICAIGIHCKRWVCYHGFAFNIVNDLSLFETIVPCGIPDKDVTSLARELNTVVDTSGVAKHVAQEFDNRFGSFVGTTRNF